MTARLLELKMTLEPSLRGSSGVSVSFEPRGDSYVWSSVAACITPLGHCSPPRESNDTGERMLGNERTRKEARRN